MESRAGGRGGSPARRSEMAIATIIHRVRKRLRPADEQAGIEEILRLRRTGDDDIALDELRWGLVALHEPLMKALILGRLKRCPLSHGESVCDLATDQFYDYLCGDNAWQKIEAHRMKTVKGLYGTIAARRVADHLRGRKPWSNDHPECPLATPAVPGQAFGAAASDRDDFEALLGRADDDSRLADPEQELFDAEIETRLFRALGGATTVDAVLVGLRLCEGLTYDEIAAVLAGTAQATPQPAERGAEFSPAGLQLARRRVLGCAEPLAAMTPGGIRVRVHRALRRIEQHFDREEPSQ